MDEAQMEQTPYGRGPAGEGWFTVGVGEAKWMRNEAFGSVCWFEAGERSFPQIGYSLWVLQPGQPNGLYHHETDQEDFLVLSGECLLLIEGQERHLKAWDFVHCPAGTDHIFVGAGEGPCAIFMIGGRDRGGDATYPRSDLALRHGAGATTTHDVYAAYPRWGPGRPDGFERLPFGA